MGYLIITSGTLKGRKVITPSGDFTRPLLTRLRKSLCDVLRPYIEKASILELFGGSGAISFDLLSNGAQRAVIAEINPSAAEIIKKNIENLKLESKVEFLTGDGIKQLEVLSERDEKFDIVIVAPPYNVGLQQKTLDSADFYKILKKGCMVVVQRHKKEGQATPSGRLLFIKTRKYGNTLFDFYEKTVF